MEVALSGVIAGGGMRADGPGRLGVFLDYDPADFGLRAAAPFRSGEGRMWSGLTGAVATDDADDSYDLSWLDELPPTTSAPSGSSASSLRESRM